MNAAVDRPGMRATGRERTLVTPEGIALQFTLASRGTRFGALVLDFALLMVCNILIALASTYISWGAATSDGAEAGGAVQFVQVVTNILLFLLLNGYFLFFELGPRGATPGKRMLGIRVAARDGGRLTAEMVIARNLLRNIELFLPLVFLLSASAGDEMGMAGLAASAWFLIFALFPFFNKDRLRAGDLIAGSWVVEAPKVKLEAAMSARAAEEQALPPAQYRFGEAELAVYGEYELQTLERVLRDNRPEALRPVYEAICRKIGWTPGGGDERAFLEAYYTQLRSRLEAGMRMGVRKADKFAGER